MRFTIAGCTLLLVGCQIHASIPSASEMADTASALERTLSALAEANVETCIRQDRSPNIPADWERVQQILGERRVSGIDNITCDAAGQLVTAQFRVKAGDFDRFSYIYDPENRIDKGPTPDSFVIEQIDAAWWFISEDWN